MRVLIFGVCKSVQRFARSHRVFDGPLRHNSLQASSSHRADLTMKPCRIYFPLLYFTATFFTSSNVVAVQVWQSTFDSGPDGVVDIAANEDNKVMIGPVNNGRLQITSEDVGGSEAYTPDKAGRP